MFASALLTFIFSTIPCAQAAITDLASLTTKDFLLGTAPTGCMPKGAKIDGSGNYLYLAEMCGKIDPVTKKRVPTASIYDVKNRTVHKTLVTPLGMKDGILANTEVEFSVDEKWAFISRAEGDRDRKSTRMNSSHTDRSRMPSSA